jgi:putative DNA primase/helicase
MLNKLKAEGPAVLAWAIRGAVHWHRDGLAIPESVRAASQDYVQCHDDLREWVDERCDREGETKAASLYSDFRVWKESRGEHAPSMTVWAERLQRTPGIERRKSNGVRYSPISIRPHAWGDQK